jgi:hypothetical protein
MIVWYQDTDWQNQSPGYRHLLVLNAGGGVAVYQLNSEHSRGDSNTEVNGATDVALFGIKCEGNFPALWVRNSTRVRGYGYGGNAAALPYNGRSGDIALACVLPMVQTVSLAVISYGVHSAALPVQLRDLRPRLCRSPTIALSP